MNLQTCYHAHIEWSPTYAFEVAECVGAGSLVDDVSLGEQQQIIEELVDGVAGLMNREDYCAVALGNSKKKKKKVIRPGQGRRRARWLQFRAAQC